MLQKPVAYFSAEFGFHESIPNYSGGLGILSGDHCKSASDLDLNFVAIGLLYRHGYFRQEIDKDGIQHAVSLNQNFHHLPIREVQRDDRTLLVAVRILDRDVYASLWELHVGRVSLYLLDTDIPENKAEDRLITAELYGGDLEMRMRQEIVLGIGGVNALSALGIEPEVFHMNEGHSAFLALERIRRLVTEKKLDFYSALQVVASANVFTTHTPVPAGNDSFPREMMRKYFGSFATEIGLPFDEFFSFGQTRVNATDPFSMTILALRLSRHSNGVSKLHGEVSRGLWKDVWAGVPAHEVPITSITNGIHTKTWMAPEFLALYDKYLGDWEEHLTERRFLAPGHRYSRRHSLGHAPEIEAASGRVRARTGQGSARTHRRIARIHSRGQSHSRSGNSHHRFCASFRHLQTRRAPFQRQGSPAQAAERLHPAGSIHFRRQIASARRRRQSPDPGSLQIQSRESGFDNRIVFVEDYDTYIARRLVQGVDLWLNNPLRPLEASGTSGMKMPPNGGLNLSVLDGWWGESYNGNNGWAIGAEINDGTVDFQSEVDASSLYQLLENQIIPLYYAKPDGKLPLAWLQLMRESIRSVTPVFNTHRMVKEYTERLYAPAAKAYRELFAKRLRRGQRSQPMENAVCAKIGRKCGLTMCRSAIKDRQNIPVGESLEVSARVHLGAVDPQHVRVEAYHGEAENGGIKNPGITMLNQAGQNGDGTYLYRGSVPASESGAYGFSIRVLPTHPHLQQEHELRLITWS